MAAGSADADVAAVAASLAAFPGFGVFACAWDCSCLPFVDVSEGFAEVGILRSPERARAPRPNSFPMRMSLASWSRRVRGRTGS